MEKNYELDYEQMYQDFTVLEEKWDADFEAALTPCLGEDTMVLYRKYKKQREVLARGKESASFHRGWNAYRQFAELILKYAQDKKES